MPGEFGETTEYQGKKAAENRQDIEHKKVQWGFRSAAQKK
jgi:hypothetical protein